MGYSIIDCPRKRTHVRWPGACPAPCRMSATGSVKHVIPPPLADTFPQSSDNEIINAIATAEQIIREYIAADPALNLIRVELLKTSQQRVLLAHLLGIRQLRPEEIAFLEIRIRKTLEDDT